MSPLHVSQEQQRLLQGGGVLCWVHNSEGGMSFVTDFEV